jgi:hypothetical protein
MLDVYIIDYLAIYKRWSHHRNTLSLEIVGKRALQKDDNNKGVLGDLDLGKSAGRMLLTPTKINRA